MKTLARSCFLVGLVSLVGCSGGSDEDHPEVVPVSGTLLDASGNPVVGATVSFWKEGAPRAASDVTDSDGKFALTMFEFEDGAMPGENKITVTKSSAATGAPVLDPSAAPTGPVDPATLTQGYQQAMPTETNGQPPAAAESEISTVFANQNTTPLSHTVPAGGDSAVIVRLTQ